MRQLFVLILMLLTLSVLANKKQTQEHKSKTEIEITKYQESFDKEVQKLREEWRYRLELMQKEHEREVDELEMKQNSYITVASLIVGGFSLLLSILLFFLDKIFATKIEGSIYKKLAKTVNGDKEALKKALRHRSIEIEITRYPITVVAESFDRNSEGYKLYKLLNDYHFEDVRQSDFDTVLKNISDYNYKEPNALIFSGEDIDEDIANKIISEKPEVGVIGFWKHKENESVKLNGETLTHSNSYGKLYENLMSLLHYMRYLKKNSSIG